VLGVFAFVAIGAWVASLWVGAGWSNGPRAGGVGTIEVARGGVVFGVYHGESIARTIGKYARPGTWVRAGPFRGPLWTFERSRFPSATSTAYEYISVPLWPGVAILSLLAAFAWITEIRMSRLLGAARCSCCGYDRRGLPADAKCPECGTVPAPASK
jgi:hypothetical protein